MVSFLLGMNTYMEGINKVGGDYGTALCAAGAKGKVEVVKALLGAGARRNVDGGEFGGPLHVAVLMENRDIVQLLLDENPEETDVTCEGAHFRVIKALNREFREGFWKCS
ncbi:hypothetical protein C8F04DRAFT_1182024 [Mycena alexandri]|uniref:Uncharacterized protein n=1 Tax=Mycena alexandri TaxID=1745969 RepID=A0AAD6SXA6_9AGAR|nr:hypothetical protein C8F04DRAFT_1182024 [Mycena alexandri]